MLVVLCALLTINCMKCSVYGSEEPSAFIQTDTKNDYALSNTATRDMIMHNVPYVDKDDNMLRMPAINRLDEKKMKRKPKKSPKRTIQKIIKKNKIKTKMRKLYFSRATNKPTNAPKIDYDKLYGQDDSMWKMDGTTTQANQKKKVKKWSNRIGRYHVPFQSLQSKRDRKHKRELSREYVVLKDLDEIQFLDTDKDYDVVNAHVQKPW